MWDEVEEFGVLGGRLLVVEVSEFGGFGPSVLGELGGAGVDFAGELVGAVGVFEAAHEAGAACVEVVDVGLEPGELFGVFSGGGDCGLVEDVLEQECSVRSEDVRGEEVADALDEGFLADPDAFRVPLGDVAAAGSADVVGVAARVLSTHQPPAELAADVGAQQVGALGVGVGVPVFDAGPLPVLVDALSGRPDVQRDDRLVRGLGRPHPFLRRVELAAVGLGGLAVEDHVAGVLRVDDDLAHRGLGPLADRAGGVDGCGWRVEDEVSVQFGGDGLIAELLGHPQVEDPGDDGRFQRVGLEGVLGGSLLAACGDGVRDVVLDVPVGRLADVVAQVGVGAEPVPGLLQQLQDVPLGDALLDAAGEGLGRALPTGDERLIGGDEQDSGAFQEGFDLLGDVAAASDAGDVLADDGVEPPVGLAGFGQEVLDASVARDRDVEALVSSTVAAGVECFASGFDVVEVGDHRPTGRQRGLGVAELPEQRRHRVLQVVGRGPPGERDPQQPVVGERVVADQLGASASRPGADGIEWDR
ncbi:hypothetical protein R9X44_00065 [Actinocorallia sp. A-T 12471]|nr:hypothetical protein [Actinocorallia sp. A-T 12471]MDX6738141.1 hypothetical protein [Actinocorallia sp. A-T 12471]